MDYVILSALSFMCKSVFPIIQYALFIIKQYAKFNTSNE